MCGAEVGGYNIVFHSISRPEIKVYLEYQSVCPIVGIGSTPPPPLKVSVSPPLDPKGEQPLWGWGTQFGRLDRRPGTTNYLHI
jgi:hypothetical protein